MLALELMQSDGQVHLIRAGWQLWDWVDGTDARLWLIRAECGCADRGGRWEKCRGHAEMSAHRVIQLGSDWKSLEPEHYGTVVHSIQAKS